MSDLSYLIHDLAVIAEVFLFMLAGSWLLNCITGRDDS